VRRRQYLYVYYFPAMCIKTYFSLQLFLKVYRKNILFMKEEGNLGQNDRDPSGSRVSRRSCLTKALELF
jgi:hypothetical protein